MTICAICAEDVVDGARFCPQCGALLGTPSGLEERKLVTAVFADLVGFTSRSEGMDVEDVRGTLVVYFRLLRQELERFGGTVEKFIGDAVVAIFGAPAAHEDDPERAVRAALSIQAVLARAREERPNFDLHVRIGVNTGEALVAIGANPHAGEGLAAGDVVNTAARLQTAAPADGVLVGEMTYRATSHVVDYTGAQAIEVKGKQYPLNVWVAREAASLDADAGRPLAAPLVGRDAQLEALWSTLERVRQERSPRLLTLTGVPGIGKSRLVLELFRRIEDTGADIRCRRGRSLPYGEGVTFWALAEMVKAEAGILHSDSGAAVARKLHQAVVGIVDDSHDAAWIESELRPLVGLERGQDLGADRQAETFAGWRLFLESLARQRPLVLVFEDIHWADQALLEFIEHLADWLAGVPVLVLCTARPELFDQRPGWLEGHANTDAIPLWPLSDGATAELITDLLGQVPLPADIEQTLLRRADGNPLYAQEYVRMLVDRGLIVRAGDRWALAEGAELPLPETVQSIIAARLDALTPEEKAIVQDASVIGKVVWVGAVAHVAGRTRWAVEEGLRRLQRKEFLRLEQSSSVGAEMQYAFQHALIRDVAYSQIVRSVRADKHLRAAAWIESLAEDRGDRVELLAHHYLTALELGSAAGSVDDALPERARGALLEAADRALGLNAFTAAVRFYTSAFELYPGDEPVPPRLRYRRAKARMYGEEVLPDDLRDIARELADGGDLESASEAESDIGIWFDQQGHKDDALDHLRRAVDLLRSAPASRAKAGALTSLASVHVLRGGLDEAIHAALESGTLANELELDDLRAWSHQTMALALLQQQDARGIGEFEQAFAIARHLESYDGAMIENNYGVCLLALGDLAGAMRVQTQARRRSERLGLPYAARLVDGALGCLLYHSGDWEQAGAIAARVIGQGDGTQHGEAVEAHTIRGRMALARGDRELAAEDARRALSLAREIGEPQYLVPALGFQAHLHVLEGRPDAAAELVSELVRDWWIGLALSAESLACAAFAASQAPAARDEFIAAASRYALPSGWVEAAAVVAAGDFGLAADRYRAIGSLPDEAAMRLHALKRGIEAGDMRPTLAWWHTVGAAGYAHEAAEAIGVGLRSPVSGPPPPG